MSALKDLKVVDLSRVLAGPLATQTLGDLGAEVIKIERPHVGDDTRNWGPPYLKDDAGNNTHESAYYLSINRNKSSLAVDITKPEGQAIIYKLLEDADVLVENFKVGSLEKYGLGYEQLKDKFPRLIYASITGYGRTGPLANEPGYDFVAQAMAGFMAATGAKDGEPTKAGVAVADTLAGLYCTIGILAALEARNKTGEGQLVDITLLEAMIAGMTNLSQYALIAGKVAPRVGNAHSTIVPYQCFKAVDGYLVIAVGNDAQFARLAEFLGHQEWAADERFKTNPARVENRELLVGMIADIISQRCVLECVEALRDRDIPTGPVQNLLAAFNEPQIKHQNTIIEMQHSLATQPLKLVANPIRLSKTPAEYKKAPPPLGYDSKKILQEKLKLSEAEIEALYKSGVVA